MTSITSQPSTGSCIGLRPRKLACVGLQRASRVAAAHQIINYRRSKLLRCSVAPATATPSTFAAASPLELSEDNEYIKLPFESTLLLGLKGKRTYTDSEVNSAYDELIEASMEEGYSEQVLQDRKDLLNAARQQIINAKGNPTKDLSAVIPMDMLPGALTILVEAEQYDIVLSYGSQILAKWEPRKGLWRDVLLTQALAHCGVASEVFANTEQVAEGCAHMEQALSLLQEAGSPALAPGLARDIIQGLEGLKAPRVLDQLKQPLPSDVGGVQARQRAVANLTSLLSGSDSSSGGSQVPATAEYARKALDCLTSDEVVRVQNWELVARKCSAGGIAWCTPMIVARAAVAYIVTGFTQHQPSLIKTASNVLKQLPATADISVARGMCEVLLGSVEASLDLIYAAESATSVDTLGLEAHSTSPRQRAVAVPAPAKALAFIEQRSLQQDDLLPGLCLFTQLWLSQVAFPLFRNTLEQPPNSSLTPYFDDARVETLLSLYEEGADKVAVAESLNSAFGKIQAALSNSAVAGANLAAVPAAAAKLDKKLLAGLGAGLLVAAAAVLAGRSRQLPSTQQQLPAVSARSSGSVARPTGLLRFSSAEAVIRRWQEAKAAALGPSYDAAKLPAVLAEPLLSQMQLKVAKFREQGWFMRYKVSRMKVAEVDESSYAAGGYVTVVATLEESAVMYGIDGRQADSYSTVYDTEYKLVRAPDGSWLVQELKVLGREPSIRHP